MRTIVDSQADRVGRHTPSSAKRRINEKTRRDTYLHASPHDVGRRIQALEREWDVERTLEANASTLALAGAALGTTVNKKWFALTAAVLSFLFQHATSGWCPPLPILRKLGIRTQSEIDQEKFALKAIRGDFRDAAAQRTSPEQALRAVSSTEAAVANHGRREPDRVRRYTSRRQLHRLDADMQGRVRLYASQPPEVIGKRISELQREWSIERYLQINVAAIGLSTAGLAVTVNRKWGFGTCAGLAFFLFHALEGFDPPMPALRRMGVRSRAEINREIYALKILRGDFDAVYDTEEETDRIQAALAAVGV